MVCTVEFGESKRQNGLISDLSKGLLHDSDAGNLQTIGTEKSGDGA
jgi:hypothetical protein